VQTCSYPQSRLCSSARPPGAACRFAPERANDKKRQGAAFEQEHFSDPLGLCQTDDKVCLTFLAKLRSLSGPYAKEAAKLLDATQRKVELVAANDERLDVKGVNSDGNSKTYVYGNTTTSIYINSQVSENTQLITVAHEAIYHNQNTRGLPTDPGHIDNRARDVPLALEFASYGIVPRGFINGLIQDGVPGAERLKPLLKQ